ncbi:DUF2339 domain-containing protein [Pseudomarimonas arenosa]|uniref:DUF2339 domain-containing protein n=1 Tax=Pseudomarimonas arenosa TaxID=2774145 RepID=A0AAW3ZQF5_9GAMM|nr:DUF2339 domain-containing protein [Pseudomarimonas arenosa]MBD8527719.1 DUF2339 domain-containing protein [Pseudomarimonas arenosa]
MSWIWALVGAIVVAILADGEPVAWILGGLVGALWGRTQSLSSHLRAMTERLAELERWRVVEAARSRVVAAQPPSAESVREDDAASTTTPATPVEPVVEPAVAPAPKPDPMTSDLEMARDTYTPPPEPVVKRVSGERVWKPTVSTEPDWFDRGLSWIKRWFTEGNVPVKIGVLVSFVGLGALLKFAAQHALLKLPVEFWLTASAAAALAALWFAWSQREQRRLFSLGLQGGALGALLMTVFAAFRMYEVLPVLAAFGFALLVVAASVVLAVKQDAKALAVLGFTGGFLAPVLLSTGSGNHVALFSYFALLNAAVFAIAWWRSWRLLNLLGFGFTFAIGTFWGVLSYRAEHFATTEPFLVLFFLMYVGINHLFATRGSGEREPIIDGTLLYGTPLFAAGLQAALLIDAPMQMAFSSLSAAGVYALLGYLIRLRQDLATLRMAYATLAVGFATAAVPLALDANVTGQIWALEGAAVLWLGLRQKRLWPKLAGSALQLVAALAWLYSAFEYQPPDTPALRNGVFVGGWIVSLAWGCSALMLQRMHGGRVAYWLFLLGAALIWLGTGAHEIEHFVSSANRRAAWLGWWLVGWGVGVWASRQLRWPDIGLLSVMCAVFGLLWALSGVDRGPLSAPLLWLWPMFLITTLVTLRWLLLPGTPWLAVAHLSLLGSLALVLGSDVFARLEQVDGLSHDWAVIIGWLPTVALLWGAAFKPTVVGQPVAERFEQYRLAGLALAGAALGLFWLTSLGQAGDASPLPFVPLINPLELMQLGLLALAFLVLRQQGLPLRPVLAALALLGWVWLSVATLRSVHHLADVAWNQALWRSMLAQTSLTVVWSLCGVAAWVWGSRSGSRRVWQAGAVLMALVLLKLGLIDRQHMSNIAGIVSFLAVGGLLTLVGYLAPSPPAEPKAEPLVKEGSATGESA